MLELLFRKKTIPLIVAGSIASLLSGCVEFLSTDKLLIFSQGVLPTSQFDSITGRYQLSEGEYWRISNIDNGLYLEFCSAGEMSLYQWYMLTINPSSVLEISRLLNDSLVKAIALSSIQNYSYCSVSCHNFKDKWLIITIS